MASMSKNPFINPPKSNNPFLNPAAGPNSPSITVPAQPMALQQQPASSTLSPIATATSETPGKAAAPVDALPALPPSPGHTPPASPRPPTQSAPTVYDPQTFMRSSQAEDLDAAIQASLSEAYPPPPGPPPLPARRRTRQTTGALNSSTPNLTASSSSPPVVTSTRPAPFSPTADDDEPDPLMASLPTRSQSGSPPPYTPAPDFRAGESTLEQGPRRPYQNAPQSHSQQPPGFFPRTRSNSQPDLFSALEGLLLPPSQFLGRASSSGGSSSRTQTNQSPTDIPTPGRPLLRDGQILVYPRHFECYKCNNTGFKSYDPSHPCRKCWQRYGRPYTAPYTSASWSNRPSDSNWQQPLPKTSGPLGIGFNRPLSSINAGPSRYIPGELYRNGSDGSWVQAVRPGERPPAGATLVRPGDPRIGGNLCWHCGGDGQISLFLFDRERCPTCNGMGRILQ